jgi:hypothetical protein
MVKTQKVLLVLVAFLYYHTRNLNAQYSLAQNHVGSAGNITELGCYLISWTLGEVSIPMNSTIISGQQGYTVKKREPKVSINGVSVCSGTEYKLIANDSLYFDTIQWYYEGFKIQGATTGLYKPSIVGNYSYKVWNKNPDCKYGSEVVKITEINLQTPTISSSGSPISLLTSSPAANYQWFVNNRLLAGETKRDYQVRYNGTYHVLVTYSNGCKATSTAFVVNERGYLDITRSGAIITDDVVHLNPDITKNVIYPTVIKENEQIKINLVSESEKVSFGIYTTDGKLIIEDKLENISDFNKTAVVTTNGLRAGTYFVKVFDNNFTIIEKLIIYK